MSVTELHGTPTLSPFEQNRLLIGDEQWRKYAQMWVGLSLDGRQIVAGAPDLVELDRELRLQGRDLSQVALEFVYFENLLCGGQAEPVDA
jgi:hypothetical protein